MIKKLLDTLKTVFAVLACILVPLLIGMYFIRSAARSDAAKCVDTFMAGEAIDLSKYISLQFACAPRDINAVAKKVREKIIAYENSKKDDSRLQQDIEKIARETPDVVMVNLFDEYGELMFSSLGEENDAVPAEVDVADTTDTKLKDNIFYSLDQLDNEARDVVVRYAKLITIPKNGVKKTEKNQKDKTKNTKKSEEKPTKDNKADKKNPSNRDKEKSKKDAKRPKKSQEEVKEFFVEVVVKWNKYENYMMNLQKGAFPRNFYIVSPDCGRYVSMNSLPASRRDLKNSAALGLHLVKQLASIPNGISTTKVESYPFLLYKEEIKMPANMVGHSFFIIEAADDSTIDEMLRELTGCIPLIIFILLIFWFAACWYLTKFYNGLKEKLEISTTISTSTPLAIAIFRTSDGKIVQINSSALSLFKINKEAIEEINFWEIFLYSDDKHYISNAIMADVNILNYEVLTQSFGGSNFWIVCSASHITIKEQSCVIFAALDINQRKEIEKKLANNAAMLEQQIKERTEDLETKAKELETSNALLEKSRKIADEANAAKTKFLANMSNELKTPINAIIGYSEILEEEAQDRKDMVTADDLQKIISSAKHLLSLIDEILDLSSIESGKVQLFFQNTGILSLLKDVESVVMPLITENDNSLSIEAEKKPGEMYIDSTKLRQCLLNLLSNAAKYTQFGKVTIRVKSTMKNGVDFVEFSVMDTGTGIEPNKLAHIFEISHDENGASIGAGLGLSLTKKYTEIMGGTIEVESESGSGSKFTITLPRKCTVESSDKIIVKNQEIQSENEEELMDVVGDVEFVNDIDSESDQYNAEGGDTIQSSDLGDDDLFESISAKNDKDYRAENSGDTDNDSDLDDEFARALNEEDGGGDLEDLDEDTDADVDPDENIEADLIEESSDRISGGRLRQDSSSKYSLSTSDEGEKKGSENGGSFGRKSEL